MSYHFWNKGQNNLKSGILNTNAAKENESFRMEKQGVLFVENLLLKLEISLKKIAQTEHRNGCDNVVSICIKIISVFFWRIERIINLLNRSLFYIVMKLVLFCKRKKM